MTHTGRPVRELCDALQRDFRWRVSFEDVPIMNNDDLVDSHAPNGIPWKEAKKDIPININIPVREKIAQTEKLGLIQGLFDSRKAARVQFRVDGDGDQLHFIPVAVKGPTGESEPFDAMLNTRISIVRGSYRLGVLVQEVLSKVSQARATSIVLATVPTNLFAQATVTEEAIDEPARDILVRAFGEINGPRLMIGLDALRLTWIMNWEPNGHFFFFNVVVIDEEDSSDPTNPVTGENSKRNGNGQQLWSEPAR